MPWRGHNAKWCHGCGRHVDECGPLSARYLCAECGDGFASSNLRDLTAKSGPGYRHWRRRTIRALEQQPLEEQADQLEEA